MDEVLLLRLLLLLLLLLPVRGFQRHTDVIIVESLTQRVTPDIESLLSFSMYGNGLCTVVYVCESHVKRRRK